LHRAETVGVPPGRSISVALPFKHTDFPTALQPGRFRFLRTLEAFQAKFFGEVIVGDVVLAGAFFIHPTVRNEILTVTFDQAAESWVDARKESQKAVEQCQREACGNRRAQLLRSIDRARKRGGQDESQHNIERRLSGKEALVRDSHNAQGRKENQHSSKDDLDHRKVLCLPANTECNMEEFHNVFEGESQIHFVSEGLADWDDGQLPATHAPVLYLSNRLRHSGKSLNALSACKSPRKCVIGTPSYDDARRAFPEAAYRRPLAGHAQLITMPTRQAPWAGIAGLPALQPLRDLLNIHLISRSRHHPTTD